MPRYEYALINKDTLRFIRDTKQVSFNYVERVAKFKEDKVSAWEDPSSDKFPTINQAKTLAKCYRVPFAGFYMDSSDINVNHLPRIYNRRTMLYAFSDDSAVNLALLDLLNDREFYIETKKALKESIPEFNFQIPKNTATEWGREIRTFFGIDLSEQYRTKSKRQFYLYVRSKVEQKGLFIQGFTGVDISVLRGVAIYDESMPIIGINDDDRYPAKTFSIIHELAHIINRTSSVCNDMFGSNPGDAEETFCNAVAGETLVPRVALISVLKNYEKPLSLDDVDSIAAKFSVSSEVIARRLLDVGICGKTWYRQITEALENRVQRDKEEQRIARQMGGAGIPRNMPREAIDRTSTAMCTVLLHGYSEGYFDKADISAHIGIGVKHIDKFVREVLVL